MKFASCQRTERIVSRHSKLLGYYVFFVKFVGNRNQQWFTIIIWIKAGKNLTYSSWHWEEWFFQKVADLYSNINAYAISIQGKFIQNFPCLVLLPYMEIAMTHTAYFHFLLISKLFPHSSSFDQFAFQKCTLEKLIVPTILNF